MKRSFRFISAALFLAIMMVSVFSFVGCDNTKSQKTDYPIYSDLASTIEASDVIIVGDVVSSGKVENLKVYADSDETMTYTLATVKVVKIIKGDLEVGDEITVKQMGDYKSDPDSTLESIDGYLKSETEGLMFLCAYSDVPYSCINAEQGIIEIKDGKLYSNSEYSLYGYKAHEDLDAVMAELSAAVK